MGLDPPRLEPFGEFGDPHLGRVQTRRVPVPAATCSMAAATRTRTCARATARAAATGLCRGGTRTIASRSRTTCRGRRGATTSSSGSSPSATARPSPGRTNYAGIYDFGHNADNPLSTGNGYANALLGVFTSYTELNNRIDQENRHWQTRRLRAGQLAHQSASDTRLRHPGHARRRGVRSPET